MIKPNRIDPTTDPAVYRLIEDRFSKFQQLLNDTNSVPIKVFDPLTKVHLDNLEVIREVSRSLQKKKEEEALKAAAQAEEDALNKQKEAEQNKIDEETNKEEEKKKEVEGNQQQAEVTKEEEVTPIEKKS